ncbi:MAG: phosphodiester glycosidase family protein [Candidatus Riflebacteria bacterium]|nr:phosphodiester glycosidase family protein [Candidatus Riflebacteria bacterium]
MLVLVLVQLALLEYFSQKSTIEFSNLSSNVFAFGLEEHSKNIRIEADEISVTSINPAKWLPLKKIERPEITGVSIVSQGAFDVLEFEISDRVKVVRKNQSNHFLQLRISPPLKPINYQTWLNLKNKFTRFSIKQRPSHTEITLASQNKLSNPYTDTDSQGTFKIYIPYLVRETTQKFDKTQRIYEGIDYSKDRVCVGNNKFTDVHILKIGPQAFKGSIYPALANEGIAQRETLSSMAKRYNAIVGINAGYFTSRGDPLGTLIIGRKLVSSPLYGRSVFGITEDDAVVFGNPEFSGTIKASSFSVPITAINQPRRGNSITVYTSEYADSTRTEETGIEIILIKGKIVGIQENDATIPPDGVVVSAGGKYTELFEQLKLGETIDINYSVAPPWNTIRQAVCGGPRLIENGNISINYAEEKFDPSLVSARHPRTAIGLSFDGDLIMTVIDGRTKQNAGMTLKELALYLQKMGIRHAINLDGGGSSTMVVKGRIVNAPSDGSERKISNGLLILKP